MATRARIGIALDNGNTSSIYSHWDNYPIHNGAILLLYYNSEDKVRELLSHGDMSSLGVKTGGDVPHEFYSREHNSIGFPSVCTFYHRDRGDNFYPAVEMTRKEMIHQEQFSYLWKDGKWWYSDCGANRFYPLGDKRCHITKKMRKAVKEELGE